jgi:hypothetical protein
MIHVPITEEQKIRAVELADTEAYKHSMRGAEANLVGALGEIITFDWLQSTLRPAMMWHTPKYDIVIDYEDPYTIDVKTKERSVVPLPEYDATVPAYNHDYQRPDVFIFTSIRRDKEIEGIDRFIEGHIIGWCTYDYLTEHAVFWDTTMVNPTNGWKPTIDCWNIRHSLLKEMSDLP